MMINSKNLDNLCANIPFSLSLSLHYRITYNDSFEYAINSCILKSSVTYANNGQLNFSINFVSIDLPLPSPPSPAFFPLLIIIIIVIIVIELVSSIIFLNEARGNYHIFLYISAIINLFLSIEYNSSIVNN